MYACERRKVDTITRYVSLIRKKDIKLNLFTEVEVNMHDFFTDEEVAILSFYVA